MLQIFHACDDDTPTTLHLVALKKPWQRLLAREKNMGGSLWLFVVSYKGLGCKVTRREFAGIKHCSKW
jgi:hypothetical protein